MKRFKILKTVSLLLITGLVTAALTGCGSNSSSASSKQNSTSASANSSGNTNNKAMNPTAMKTLYTNVLKELVTAKTITQEQSDKVLAAVTKNMPTDNNSAGGQKPSDNGSNGGQNSNNSSSDGTQNQNGTAPANGTKSSGNPPSGGQKPTGQAPNGGQNGSNVNPQSHVLSQLVTDKVITQAQADTISQKVQAAMSSSQSTSTN